MMMNHLRRSIKPQNASIFRTLFKPAITIDRSPKLLEVEQPIFARQFSTSPAKPLLGANGLYGGNHIMSMRSYSQLVEKYGKTTFMTTPCFARSFASRVSPEQESSQTRRNGTSKFAVIALLLFAVGVATYTAAVFLTIWWFCQREEFKAFKQALSRIQADTQVTLKLGGGPIANYVPESENRSDRGFTHKKIYTDEDGVEHIEVNFNVRSPHGVGKAYAEMFKDKMDKKKWNFTYLVVETTQPTQTQFILESSIPESAVLAKISEPKSTDRKEIAISVSKRYMELTVARI